MQQFKVKMWIGSNPTEVTIQAMNSANALSIARKLYPMARVISARAI